MASPRKALVIGIKYDGTDEELQGPTHDAKRIVTYLTGQAGWDTKSIVVMTEDSKTKSLIPTLANIKTQLNSLVEFAKKNDQAQIWLSYSGHGLARKDKNGDETDGYDEMIVSSDEKDFSDDDFYSSFIAKLPSKTNAFLCIDSCNSGTFSDLPYLLRSKDGSFKVASNNSSKTKGNIICFSGCRDDQSSWDSVDQDDNKPGGAATSTLLHYLQQTNALTSLNELLTNIVNYLKDLKQEPVVSAGYKINPDNSLNQLGIGFILPQGYQQSMPITTNLDVTYPVTVSAQPAATTKKSCVIC